MSDNEFEIMNLDPDHSGSRVTDRWMDGQRFSPGLRRRMTLFLLLSIVLFSLLLLSSLHLPGTAPISEKAASIQRPITSGVGLSDELQWYVVGKITYTVAQDGTVMALWPRNGIYFLLWLHYITPASTLVKVSHNVMYFISPTGSVVALRASDGFVVWSKRRK